MSNPIFSIVIPTYNRSAELRRCLNSLQYQTFKQFEVIVCDDGSTDNTVEVIKSFESKLEIKYFFQDNWGGPARPRNIGLYNSSAEWICFLDSDDWWFPNKLSECVKFINDYDFVFHDAQNYNNEDIVYNVYGDIISILKCKKPQKLLSNGNFIHCSSVCIRKSLTDDYFFPEDKSIISLEDYFAWIKLVLTKNVRFKYIYEKLSAYSIGSDNISNYNRSYLFKLFSLKRKIKFELGVDSSGSCINYLIGINLFVIGEYKKSIKIFRYNICNADSLVIKIKSLVRSIR